MAISESTDMSEKRLQEIRKILIEKEITEELINNIIDELKKQSENVIKTFLMKLEGYSQKQIAFALNVSQPRITQYFSENLKRVKELIQHELYLKTVDDHKYSPNWFDLQLLLAQDIYAEEVEERIEFTKGRIVNLRNYERHAHEFL